MSRHIADRLPACQKIPAPKRKDPESPVSKSNFFTEVPASEKHESASPELPSYCSHIFDAITQKQKVTERHEKPVLDEYYEDLEALGGGRKDAHPGNGGAIDRMSLEEAAKLKVQAGLKAAEPAIAEDIKPYEDEMISVYKPIAGNARILAQPRYFSRAEVAHTHKTREANRQSWGLPLDGDTDHLTPKDPEGKQQQSHYSGAKSVYGNAS